MRCDQITGCGVRNLSQQKKLDNPTVKKQSSSISGFINSRNLVAVLFCTVGISLVMLSFSATASSRKTTSKQQTTQTTVSARPAHGPAPAAPVSADVAPTPTSGTLTNA